MASLYKRATKKQQLMLRIIAGAVRNAAHAHGIKLEKNFARSVAKRAVGTLSAHLSEPANGRGAGTGCSKGLATPLGDGHEEGATPCMDPS